MIHLVIGGTRSGKSRYAEEQVLKMSENNKLFINKSVVYVATATAGDDEMSERIKYHQQSRPNQWELIEEPLFLSSVINSQKNNQPILIIECMTLWLSNWLCREDKNQVSSQWLDEKNSFLSALKDSLLDIVIVSNEVGSGIVPMGELSRQFADQAGWLNQDLAKIADKVTLVVAGCPIEISPIKIKH